MRHRLARLVGVVLMVGLLGPSARAQFVVFDPSNYAEAILQVEQLIKEYLFLLDQARRLPVDMASRYYLYTPGWAPHDLGSFYADAFIGALNDGDPSGAGYRSMADLLDSFPSVAWRMPAALSGPLATQYADIELADRIAISGIDQVGQMRETTNIALQLIPSLEADAYSSDDIFHTQVAVLNKINAANIVGLRIAVQNHEFLGDTLEQLIVDNKRKRDAETRLMNATINQWRYGSSYGQDLFSRTAADVNGWRPF